MEKKKHCILPVNRVEGDLKIQLSFEDNVVTDAKAMGTLYRGIENLMTGRGPLDGLVITPRICGICTTAHLNCAARALDMAFNARVPDNGKRLRNITLMVEQIQNDMRHSFLLFMPDATNPAYKNHELYHEARDRYTPLKGRSVIQTVRETKKILEIIAILGGQWPHSSFMVPGGVVSVPSPGDIAICRHLIKNFTSWYERNVIGCAMERLTAVNSQSELFAWLDEKRSHAESDLGFFIRFCKSVGLDQTGKGHGSFLSFGSLDMPGNTTVQSPFGGRQLIRSGFVQNGKIEALEPDRITEDITCSWLYGGQIPRRPFEGKTVTGIKKPDGSKYSWAKAPRYEQKPAETGPMAEMLANKNALFMDIINTDGPSVFARQLARLIRPAHFLPALDLWLSEMVAGKSEYFEKYDRPESCRGYGLIHAPRGALGHWVVIENNRIKNYQVITPTAWNASPMDMNKVRGPMEEAVVGTVVRDMDNPIEVEHIIRSFDPCLVCTVH